MDVTFLILSDLAELGPAENLTDVTLSWFKSPCIKEVFPVLKRWRKLRRLTLHNFTIYRNSICPLFEVVSDFIKEMKHLSYLHIGPYCRSIYDQLKILRNKVNEFILPRRPYFKFDISVSMIEN